MHWNLQSLLLEVPARGAHGGTFLLLLSQEGAVAPSARVVVVPQSVGAGAALYITVFNHLVSLFLPHHQVGIA